ncbi:hypothetical protein HYH03_016696 [Edaphochlamys debaryana]|uniref:Glutathione S-transferase 3, mitochondrial n=1 Tax=Edaphochlamys debaryana TaxID=47281 RepID=A0A835XP33_9CHLO|nr:hypothetical protein HYH03_016696 [Edaphochlamys debaryana]|eukprot:KAG2484460.1 hypothetical protein HYH03_016696 [Edaphochlamys debaryana]
MAAVSPEFGYVAGVVAASWLVHHGFMAVGVMQARKKYGVNYPDLYATAENCPNAEYRKPFNCVQRGHQNSLENQPIFLALLISAGLKHPITAAVAGLTYLAGKVLYFKGYSSGDPAKRNSGGGAIAYIGLFTLVGVVGKWAVQTALAALKA